jgi:hypothetical protein
LDTTPHYTNKKKEHVGLYNSPEVNTTTEQVCLEAKFWISTREVLGSNVGPDTSYAVFVIFFSPAKQIPGYHID